MANIQVRSFNQRVWHEAENYLLEELHQRNVYTVCTCIPHLNTLRKVSKFHDDKTRFTAISNESESNLKEEFIGVF